MECLESVLSNGSGSRTLAWELSPCVLTFLANAEMAVARLFPAFSSSESVHLSKGSSPKPSSTGSSGLLSLLGVDSVRWDLGGSVRSSSGWCSGNGTKHGERCWLEATGVLVPLQVRIGIELRALEFLDVLGGMFGYLRLKEWKYEYTVR